jgi:uncharacterized membrane protein YdbT with pleckstrin-like domain
MAYVPSALAPDETVRSVARIHWIMWLRAWAALLVLGVIVIGVVWFVHDMIVLTSTETVLTDRRLIAKRGMFDRHVMDLELTSVEAVIINQGFWGRMLGFGRVEVHGTGDDVWRTPVIADPVKFRREIEAALSALPGRGRGAAN